MIVVPAEAEKNINAVAAWDNRFRRLKLLPLYFSKSKCPSGFLLGHLLVGSSENGIEIEKEVFVWCASRRVLWCIFMKKRRYGGNRQKKDFPVVEISEKTRIRHLSCSGREKLSKMLVIGGEICQ